MRLGNWKKGDGNEVDVLLEWGWNRYASCLTFFFFGWFLLVLMVWAWHFGCGVLRAWPFFVLLLILVKGADLIEWGKWSVWSWVMRDTWGFFLDDVKGSEIRELYVWGRERVKENNEAWPQFSSIGFQEMEMKCQISLRCCFAFLFLFCLWIGPLAVV